LQREELKASRAGNTKISVIEPPFLSESGETSHRRKSSSDIREKPEMAVRLGVGRFSVKKKKESGKRLTRLKGRPWHSLQVMKDNLLREDERTHPILRRAGEKNLDKWGPQSLSVT